MVSSGLIELSRRFGQMRRERQTSHPISSQEAFDQAQLAILDVVQAVLGVQTTEGTLTEEQILAAIGDAQTPNAVSRATRYRLPELRI